MGTPHSCKEGLQPRDVGGGWRRARPRGLRPQRWPPCDPLPRGRGTGTRRHEGQAAEAAVGRGEAAASDRTAGERPPSLPPPSTRSRMQLATKTSRHPLCQEALGAERGDRPRPSFRRHWWARQQLSSVTRTLCTPISALDSGCWGPRGPCLVWRTEGVPRGGRSVAQPSRARGADQARWRCWARAQAWGMMFSPGMPVTAWACRWASPEQAGGCGASGAPSASAEKPPAPITSHPPLPSTPRPT